MATTTKTVPYSLYLPEDIVLETNAIPIANKQEIEIGGLIFTGKNRTDYGQYRNQNFLSLLANFSSPEVSPGVPDTGVVGSSPLIGQTWFNQTDGELYLYTGSWVTLGSTLSFTASEISVSPTVLGQSNVQDALESLETSVATNASDLAAHIAANPAHAAANISVSPAVSGQSNVQDALEDLEADIAAISLSANNITFAPYLTIGSTDVQAAIEELKDEVDVIAGGSVTASAVSVSPTVNGESNVQDSLEDLNARINTNAGNISTNSSNISTNTSNISTNASNLSSHLSSTSAHDADEIVVSPTVLGENRVQGALEALETAVGSGGGVSETGTTTAITPTISTNHTRTNPLAGGAPDMLQVVLVCQVADLGFSPGDIVVLNPQGVDLDEGSGPGQTGNLLAYLSGTNQVRASFQWHVGGFDYPIASTTGYNNLNQINPARWDAFIKAIRF